jgi:hypothetical protein
MAKKSTNHTEGSARRGWKQLTVYAPPITVEELDWLKVLLGSASRNDVILQAVQTMKEQLTQQEPSPPEMKRLSQKEQNLLHALLEKQQTTPLTPSEGRQLKQLVDKWERLSIQNLKAWKQFLETAAAWQQRTGRRLSVKRKRPEGLMNQQDIRKSRSTGSAGAKPTEATS